MAIVWDSGTAITGAGDVERRGELVRVELTTIPDYLSSTSPVPLLYRHLGFVGALVGDYRMAGYQLEWASQFLEPLPDDADGIWWRLVNGASGILYQGVEAMTDVAIGVSVYRDTPQSVPHDTAPNVIFNVTHFDPWGMHDSVATPDRITVPVPGWYQLSGWLTWDFSTSGRRQIYLVKNQATIIQMAVAGYWPDNTQPVSQLLTSAAYLAAGENISIQAYQSSGAALDILGDVYSITGLSVVRLA